MNQDLNQHETHITAPDDSTTIVREAVLPPVQPKVVIPGPSDDATGVPPAGRPTAGHRGTLYGMSLAWRGLRLLGVTFGIAGVWFVSAWVRHGRMPMGGLSRPSTMFSFGDPPSPIFPPLWLVGTLGFLALVSFAMMLLGTRDVVPKMKFKKSGEPNKACGR